MIKSKEGNLFASFNCNLEDDYFKYNSREVYKNTSTLCKKELDVLIGGRVIDASKIQEQWFPTISADIFISHSHADEDKAISLANYFFETLGLKCFIDSCIWQHSDELLSNLNNTYNVTSNNQGYGKLYGHENANKFSEHVNMILMSSLVSVMDRCECVFFLNTPNSISCADDKLLKGKTFSPWIYHELLASKLLRKAPTPIRKLKLYEDATRFRASQPIFTYDPELNHLIDLNSTDIEKWAIKYRCQEIDLQHPLDILYEMKKITRSN